eukprot:764076-Hanusia_phi.AAC.2
MKCQSEPGPAWPGTALSGQAARSEAVSESHSLTVRSDRTVTDGQGPRRRGGARAGLRSASDPSPICTAMIGGLAPAAAGRGESDTATEYYDRLTSDRIGQHNHHGMAGAEGYEKVA